MELHKELRQLRQESGMTQVQLAAALGIDQSTVSGIEKGTPTTTKVMLDWVRVCGGQLTVVAAHADPWRGIPQELRSLAVEVARLWSLAPEAIKQATLLTLGYFGPKA